MSASISKKVTEVTELELQGEGLFTGQVHADTLLPHGSGRMEYFSLDNHADQDDVGSYEGRWEWGQWHGSGVLLFRSGDSYIGTFSQNERHGQGMYLWADGRCYEGEFQQNQRHGQGTFTFADGAVYQGEFVTGRRQGHGKYRFPNGNSYDGEWVAGEYEGYGVFSWKDGRQYRGQWTKSKHHGYGVELDAFGQVVYEGNWVDHKPLTKDRSTKDRESSRKTPTYPHEIMIFNNSPINDDFSQLGGMSVVEVSQVELRRIVTPPSECSQPVRETPRPIVLDSSFDPPGLREHSIHRGPTRTQQVYRFAAKATVQQPPVRENFASSRRPEAIRHYSKQKSQGEQPVQVPFEGLPQISGLIQEQRDALAKCNASRRRRKEPQQHPQHNKQLPAYGGTSYVRDYR